MSDLAAPRGQSPSLTTQSDRESASASDIEMESLVPAHEHSDQIPDPHESDVNTVAGVSDPPATLHTSQHHPLDPDIDSRLRSITAVPDKRPSIYNRLVMDTWVCEIIAMVFSVGCIVAIAFTVGNYNGGAIPLLRWGITLNTLIAVLSTAARAALIFVVSSSIGQLKWCWLARRGTRLQDIQVMDEASRGPLGAIKVLAKWIGGPLASLDATITICMIAFGPFLQQLVAYPNSLAEEPSLRATTPKTVNYTLLWDFDGEGDQDALFAMGDFLDAYLALGSDAFTPRAICPRPAVQCAWIYKSVGWCSKCRTTSGRLSDCVVKDHRGSNASFCQLIVDSQGAELAGIDRPKLMRHMDPLDNISSVSLQYRTSDAWSANVSAFVADNSTIIQQPLLMFTHVATVLDEEVFLNLYYSDQPELRIKRVNECVLTLCEREYNATTVDGKTSWDIISTDYGKRFESDSYWRPEKSAEGVVLTSPDGGLTRLDETERAFCPIGRYFDVIEDADMTSSGSLSYNLTHSWQDPDDQASDIDPKEYLASVAAAFTNYGLNLTTHNAVGESYLPQVTVHVRWKWIALPAFLELASAVLFLSTIFYSRHVRVPIWKSSLLAIYYHEIEDLHEKRLISLLSEMDKASSTTSVRISRSGDYRGFMLRRVRHERELQEERQQGDRFRLVGLRATWLRFIGIQLIRANELQCVQGPGN
jgi:hypothetical protein